MWKRSPSPTPRPNHKNLSQRVTNVLEIKPLEPSRCEIWKVNGLLKREHWRVRRMEPVEKGALSVDVLLYFPLLLLLIYFCCSLLFYFTLEEAYRGHLPGHADFKKKRKKNTFITLKSLFTSPSLTRSPKQIIRRSFKFKLISFQLEGLLLYLKLWNPVLWQIF